ncbi:putative autophagy-related protein 11 [Impatiens glandulifera]|uniref:putative autophagy-related protein 11 n=1 Tax=Impatiens glandulifera TaxID=253017 RepID=UPI001FB051C6|nr:putative autophagy-related protein 11 [Impatiens glandulifera]
MFKPTRWRSEKNKIKAVFKLQFQATQVPKLKAKSITISLVPADIGKPTVKLEKAEIVDGSCYWESPVYETVKLTREAETGRINEKAYHFVLSTGSSKSGFLGSACLNFADFLEEDKPLLVSLSLYGYNHEEISAILHVTIQKMQGHSDQRCIKENEAAMVERQNQDTDGNATYNLIEETRNEEHGRSLTNPQYEDHTSLYATSNHMHQRSNTDCSMGSASDGSTFDSINSPEEMLLEETITRASDGIVERHETGTSRLQRQAEVTDLEVQALRKQIVKEGKRGLDLSRRVASLKEERHTLIEEADQLRTMLNRSSDKEVSLQMEVGNSKILLDKLRKELNNEKDMNSKLRLKIKKTEDSNSKFVLALRDVEEILMQKNDDISDLYAKTKSRSIFEDASPSDGVDFLKQKILDLHIEMEECKRDRVEIKLQKEKLVMEYEALKKENLEKSQNLEQNSVEEVKMQNECLKYLKTIEDYALEVERLEKRNKKQALELSVSSSTISELQNQVKEMEKELIKQTQVFEEALEGMTHAKVEQEQRAINAEDVMRKNKMNNVITAQRIQEEFRKISLGMETKLDENEKLATKAVTEANDLRLQKEVLEEMLQKANKELRRVDEKFALQLQDFSNETNAKTKQLDEMNEELKEKCVQIENLQRHVEEIKKAFSLESQILRDEMGRVKEGQSRNGTEHIKKSLDVQSWNDERKKLERELDLMRKEAQKVAVESEAARSLKDVNKLRIKKLLSDIEAHQIQHSQLKHRLAEEELKNENLKKEVFRLESYVQEKEKTITKFHDSGSAENVAADTRDFDLQNLMMGGTEHTANKSMQSKPETHSGKEVNLLQEVAQLKEKNMSSDRELKEMQERYSEISLKFAEVEGERQQLVMTLRNLKNRKKN